MNRYLVEGTLAGREIAALIDEPAVPDEPLDAVVAACGGTAEHLLFGGGDLALFAVVALPDSDAAVTTLVTLVTGGRFTAGPRLARLLPVGVPTAGELAAPGDAALFRVRGMPVASAAGDGGLAAAIGAAHGRVVGCYRIVSCGELVAVVALPGEAAPELAAELRRRGDFTPGLEVGRVLSLDDLRRAASRPSGRIRYAV